MILILLIKKHFSHMGNVYVSCIILIIIIIMIIIIIIIMVIIIMMMIIKKYNQNKHVFLKDSRRCVIWQTTCKQKSIFHLDLKLNKTKTRHALQIYK